MRKKRTGSGRLAQKLFGFPGLLAVRNFQRSRSKYRSTVASLVLSLVLFISASGFCSYLTGSVETVANTGTKETRVDISYQISGSERPDPEEVLSLLANAGNTENAAYYEADGREFSFPREALTEEALEMLQMLADRSERYWGSLVFLRDSAFQKLCEANGFAAEEYFDAAKPKALVWNRVFLRMETEEGLKRGSFPLLKERQVSSLSAQELKRIDGYVPGGLESYEDGRELACYYPVSEDGETLWEQEPLRMPLAEAQIDRAYAIGGYLREPVFGLPTVSFALVYPYSLKEAVLGSAYDLNETEYAFQAANHARSYSAMENALAAAGMDASRLNDMAASDESSRLLVMAINVFAYGFILLISLIAVTNVFNTISTNVLLRRREFAMLRSVGLGSRGFRQMMNYECLIYGLKALLLGLPAAVLVTFAVWRLVLRVTWSGFYIPWQSLVIAIFSVFAVVFLTMLYAAAKVRRLNVVDALKDENL